MRLTAIALTLALLGMQTPVLTNDDIVLMVKGGIADSVVIAKIRGSHGKFDTSPATLISLKQQGVSDAILEAMTQPGVLSVAPAADHNDPLTYHDAGIYVMKDDRGVRKLTLMEPNSYSQMRNGMSMPLPLPLPVTHKWRALVRGAHARLQLDDPKPAFYFYFNDPVSGPAPRSPSPMRASGPNQYTLVRFDVKQDHRELEIGGVSMAGGVNMGISSRQTVDFDFERLASGVYKVWPRTHLDAGEYCFALSSPGAAGFQLMDFGISPGK